MKDKMDGMVGVSLKLCKMLDKREGVCVFVLSFSFLPISLACQECGQRSVCKAPCTWGRETAT